MDFFELFRKVDQTKKDILDLLDNQKVLYHKTRNHLIIQGYPFLNLKEAIVKFRFKRQKSVGVVIEVSYIDDHDAILSVQTLKETLTEKLGVPQSDNSLHQTKDIIIGWNLDQYIYLQKIDDTKKIVISFNNIIKRKVVSPKHLMRYTSLGGGIVFGLLMYLIMGGVFGYTLFNFVINMLGGLLWGILFGCFISKFSPPADPYRLSKIHEKLLQAYKSDTPSNIQVERCFCVFQNKKIFKPYLTDIYFFEDRAVFVYVKIRRIVEIDLPYQNIDAYINRGSNKEVVLFLNDRTGLIIYHKNGLHTLIPVVDHHLGYDEDTFKSLVTHIKDSLMAFDLMGLIRGGADPKIFDIDSTNIARLLYQNRPSDATNIEATITNYFEEVPLESFKPLADLIYRFYQDSTQDN